MAQKEGKVYIYIYIYTHRILVGKIEDMILLEELVLKGIIIIIIIIIIIRDLKGKVSLNVK